MSLRIRRGTDAQRQTVQLDSGELAYTTDTQQLFVGDGTTIGGHNILATSAGSGLIFDSLSQTLKLRDPSGITSVSQDTNPTLGGTLALNGNNINGTGNITINGYVRTNIATSTGSASYLMQRSRGTISVPTTVITGDILGGFAANGYNGTVYKNSANIIVHASAKYPITTSTVPGRMIFQLADGTGVLNTPLEIDADMGVRLAQYTPGGTSLGVYSYIPSASLSTYTNFGRHAGTQAVPLAVATGDRIHTIRFMGYDGTVLSPGATINSNVYGTVSPSQFQADLRITCRTTSGTYISTQINTATSIQFGVMPILPTFAGTAAADAAVVVPLNGMMFYDSSTSKITARQNGAWVVLA